MGFGNSIGVTKIQFFGTVEFSCRALQFCTHAAVAQKDLTSCQTIENE